MHIHICNFESVVLKLQWDHRKIFVYVLCVHNNVRILSVCVCIKQKCREDRRRTVCGLDIRLWNRLQVRGSGR